ncbi:type VI secretion system ATPase TssH [Buttiauxella sp. S04-F03]|uniref:type VI secretion system ATPase TssH n=1 Tax=Buttiauxella sp. W03-F01 TaxID=2904524 RepID=UPI001E3188E1|nr:type VI secretion system ATPase TssH [Buttiauxella sp. W03-F01]MCE0798978.1 type VI secretion system ATPase TssH [Buttiauxella sp. W03-F01]
MSNYLKSILHLLRADARSSLDKAIGLAVARTHHEVDVEHLLLALVSNHADLVEGLCLNTGLQGDQLVSALQKALDSFRTGNTRGPVLSESLTQFIEAAWLHASVNWQQKNIASSALFACLLTDEKGLQQKLPVKVQQALECDTNEADSLLKSAASDRPSEARPESGSPLNENSALAKYTHNLTEQARTGQLDPVLGREVEIRQTIDILLRRRQNNPVLTGEPGVGKTALAEGLAQRIVAGSVPDALKTLEVFTLDMGLLQAGASVKGEFENRLQKLLKEVKQHPQPILLFIDEAHTLIGAGGTAGQNDAANLLKPALARGEVRVMAATTWAEYKKYFEKDAALARRFQVVKVAEPDEEMATAMLRSMAPVMARHHKVQIMNSALTAAVQLSSRYIVGRQLPDKSVSLLDTACARVAVSQCHQPKEIEDLHALLNNLRCERDCLLAEGKHQPRLAWIAQRESELSANLAELQPVWQQQRLLVNDIQSCTDEQRLTELREELKESHRRYALVFDCVDDVCVADVVAGWTGIPLGRMLEKSSERINELPKRLQQRVIGQDAALNAIAQQIRIAQAGINDPVKPTGVFMLAGPSGVGKTETALTLAELIYGGERGLITINMSEYQEAHSVSGLKGSPPGYVGYGQGGVLTEAVRRNPHSVVLLDEVEKAHPDVMELFYQVFDKGWMEDAEGQQVNFRNTLIILTSNLASEQIMTACEQKEMTSEALCALIRPEFDRVFRPALMGRVQLIPYLPIQGESLQQIIRLKLDKVGKRVAAANGESQLKYQPKVVAFIAEHCLVAQSGARDIDAVINKLLMPLLADILLDNSGVIDQKLTLTVSKGQIALARKAVKDVA